ncbi:hydantoinase B/oxoprolinase family protein [Corallincola platygyrae]|uniref:Hydantoinase B/oxoprolinase family protein n=1 Tax=Corallincola platygyrae TaxID=1193278 RepID=A0ABW4XKC1_9GAMM
MHSTGWQFWIDRGGTFTDIVAIDPQGHAHQHKLLSENPSQYQDAALQGIRDLIQLDRQQALTDAAIDSVKMGTTVATNALLERKGDDTALVITQGFKDALVIGYQHRAELFHLRVSRPEPLYKIVVEAAERVDHDGTVVTPLDLIALKQDLEKVYQQGIRAIAIAFIHGYEFPAHELAAEQLAKEIGFTQISVSHQVSPLIKLISRGETTVVDAYLSPILRRYIDRIDQALGHSQLQFMQSSGGLTEAHRFQGKDAILSGPAGGVVGMVETAREAGFDKVIGFDMGGTSTDVSLFNGEYERSFDTEVAGVRMRAPMMSIHTVAAGGGSILSYDGSRFTVGPESAGAFPGPASYRNGGPLTVTDINVLLGKIQPDFFPKLFGPNSDEALDHKTVTDKFAALAAQVSQAQGKSLTPEQVASGFLRIAVTHMANAIKKISTQRGHDVSEYAMACFGGAGAQHACLVAEQLGIPTVFIHRLSGVLSAYGMGLAQVTEIQQKTVELPLSSLSQSSLSSLINELSAATEAALSQQDIAKAEIETSVHLRLRYQGSDTQLRIPLGTNKEITKAFHHQHLSQFGFVQSAPLILAAVEVESREGKTVSLNHAADNQQPVSDALKATDVRPVFFTDKWYQTPFYKRSEISVGTTISGPAILLEPSTTVVVEPGWVAQLKNSEQLVLVRSKAHYRSEDLTIGSRPDPIMLEVFNNLFMHIAEQMGTTLQQTASSVNIKERLDFSCAIFDTQGDLVANAPHMPVHLGSMSESVRHVCEQNASTLRPGDSVMLNSPYHGGTHLPDVTVVSPLFDEAGEQILFYVASRGHHADIGGITPGSMPAHSQSIEQEGILFENFFLVRNGDLELEALRSKLAASPYPARDPEQNIADLKAQLAANQRGIKELGAMLDHFGVVGVQAYMKHVQDYAELCVRQAIEKLSDGEACIETDDGSQIRVKVSVDRVQNTATLDFSGTSAQHSSNFNAPQAITKAVVLYVFRSLVDAPIPLNSGCLKPLQIIIPADSMLAPVFPAAVVAGNVETSQCITDVLLSALGVQAGSQGTMNNLTFGNQKHQYYETLCGGTGAGPDFNGCDAIHSHMTNSRLTDPEVLESRYPVRLESFSIRQGSGGQGVHTGGNGVQRTLRFKEAMTVSLLGNRRTVPPQGLKGGQAGSCGENVLLPSVGEQMKLPACCQVEVEAGDCLEIRTPGGGGYGTKDKS